MHSEGPRDVTLRDAPRVESIVDHQVQTRMGYARAFVGCFFPCLPSFRSILDEALDRRHPLAGRLLFRAMRSAVFRVVPLVDLVIVAQTHLPP